MPLFDITDDDATTRLFYEIRTPNDDALDLSLPVLLLLAPTSLDSRAMSAQYEDDQLRKHFTLLTVDERCTGRSQGPQNMACDAWVQAADLARLIFHLGLPPVHVFTSQAGATRQAVRLAVLFPELVRSLIVGGIILDILITPTPRNEFYDMFNTIGVAKSPEEVDIGISKWISYFFGDADENLAPAEVRQQVYDWFKEDYTGSKSEKMSNIARIIFYRTPVPRDLILNLHKPTLLFWGTENSSCPVMVAVGMSHRYKSADGKPARLEVIDGAPNLLSMSHSKLVNAKIADFVRAHHDSAQRPVAKGLEKDVPYWEEALKRFAQMIDDPELGIAHRNPKSNLSFSALTRDRVVELDQLRKKWTRR